MRNAATSQDERRMLHDFLGWRRDVRSIEELGAYRTLERNLILGDARPEPVTVAEITASAFRLARVPPLLGRPLLETDEQPGAPPVVVLGYTVWQRRFGGRTDAIGQTVQLGQTQADRRRRHAGGLRVSDQSPDVGAAATPAVRLRAARRGGASGCSAGSRRERRRRRPTRSSRR